MVTIFKMADEESRKRGKQKKGHYVSNNKKRRIEHNLAAGMRGVLITCNEKRERFAVRETYNILNEYADEMYGQEKAAANENHSSESEDEDIEKAIAKEKQELKFSFQRFQSVKCGAKNVLFIKTSLPNDEDPKKLVHTVLSDMLENGLNKSRNCMRFLPVGMCCHASLNDIESAAEELFKDSLLSPDCKPCKFCVVYKARNNGSIHRDDVIRILAQVVGQAGMGHTVDLNHPDLTICVEIVKTICCLTVVEDFYKLKKYNIQEIQNASKNKDNKPSEENLNGESTEKKKTKETSEEQPNKDDTDQNTNNETTENKVEVKEETDQNKTNETSEEQPNKDDTDQNTNNETTENKVEVKEETDQNKTNETSDAKLEENDDNKAVKIEDELKEKKQESENNEQCKKVDCDTGNEG